MSDVKISQVDPSELTLVNRTYAEIKFKLSTPGDFILKATIGDKVVGLGRLVPVRGGSGELGGIYVLPEFRGKKLADLIVSSLLERGIYQTLWCIPFEPLQHFYRKFGFTDVTTEKIPVEIKEKLEWCEGRYPDKAILLVRVKN